MNNKSMCFFADLKIIIEVVIWSAKAHGKLNFTCKLSASSNHTTLRVIWSKYW